LAERDFKPVLNLFSAKQNNYLDPDVFVAEINSFVDVVMNETQSNEDAEKVEL
jgi:hypothetical protein